MKSKLDLEIDIIPGIGPKKKTVYNKLGIKTIKDLLMHYPMRYEDRRHFKKIADVHFEEKVCIEGKIISVDVKKPKKNMVILRICIYDNTQKAFLTVFNNPYIQSQLTIGRTIKAYGTAKRINGICNLSAPEIDFDNYSKKTGIIYPVYPLTRGLFNDEIIKSIKWILQSLNIKELEYLNSKYRQQLRLCELDDAIKNIHFPKDPLLIKVAKFRLVFDEFFLLNIGLSSIKHGLVKEPGIKHESSEETKSKIEAFVEELPFELTKAQSKVMQEITRDMASDKPMQRLVQGDVGSGKTVIAMIAAYYAYINGYQCALMAPTEILAKQHYNNFLDIFKNTNAEIRLLTGSTTAKNKRIVYEELLNGSCDIVIGTHALIEDKVKFNNLSLVITDEQHRFGVRQRSKLLLKNHLTVDMLVMTATPIPRTLAFILHGDLDISVIDQMPSGRKPIKTFASKKQEANKVYDFAKQEIALGRQIYIVCPLIEESENLDIQAANELFEKLSESVFKGYKLALLHGKMKAQEKQEIMDEFSNGRIDVLISTTVIEVGVNVPNSSVMIIQDAQRFGLSQLHQLRGRVGRGEYQSYCVLLYEGKNKYIEQRMKIMQNSNDGFEISQKDLELRGPGEYFGTRQHGLDNFKLADISKHISILNLAKAFVDEVMREDPELKNEENKAIKIELDKRFNKLMG